MEVPAIVMIHTEILRYRWAILSLGMVLACECSMPPLSSHSTKFNIIKGMHEGAIMSVRITCGEKSEFFSDHRFALGIGFKPRGELARV